MGRRLQRWGKRFLKGGLVASGTAWIALLVCDRAFPFPEARIAEQLSGGSPLVLDREGGVVAWRVDARETWRLPVGIDTVSPWIVAATIAAEDKRYRDHPGVDLLAVLRAAGQNLLAGRRISGGSTITMQTIRLLEPRPRTYATKCVESFRALQIERLLGKGGVLELYLNLAPYGGNVVGVEAASRRYFGKPASELTLGEAALLAGIPQSPSRFDPTRHLDRALRRRAFVFGRMQALGMVSGRELRDALRRPVWIGDGRARTMAPRFADRVIARHGGGVVRTTLDPSLQRLLHDVTRPSVAALRRDGIDGFAALVVDVPESSVVAVIGSSDPDDPRHGWVNTTTAPRQPGSLLKPFLYAAAYERGLLVPRTAVYDVPTAWGAYRPNNMDREYRGLMTAAEALAASRNLPAVRLLDRMGTETFARDLAWLGIAVPAAGPEYGLTLALGTAEVSLERIAAAYAALARGGVYRPLRFESARKEGASIRVHSAGAAYFALRSLGAAEPGDPFTPAWKTGTSWDRRDAWAVAISPRYVVAIWCGRMSGGGHPSLVGSRAALPVALEVLDRIDGTEIVTWDRPPGVRLRPVCSLSGAPPGSACSETIVAETLAGVSSDIPCRLHRFEVRDGRRQVVVRHPHDVASFLASPIGDGPADGPGPSLAGDSGPDILFPENGATYVLAPGDPLGEEEIPFRLRAPSDGTEVYWFLGGCCVGRTRGEEEVHWPMRPGRHELVASDAAGNTARAVFTVVTAASERSDPAVRMARRFAPPSAGE